MFRIFDVTTWPPLYPEQVGSREKEWLTNPLNGKPSLLKFPREDRPEIGEVWSEKLACEMAALLSLPHVHYELAAGHEGRIGVVCESFVERNLAQLLLGNELLGISGDEPTATRRLAARQQHTLNRVLTILRRDSVLVPAGYESKTNAIQMGIDVFVGFL